MKFNTKLFALTLTSIVLALALTLSVSAGGLGLNTLTQPASVLHNADSFTVTFNLTNNGNNTSVDFSTSSMKSGVTGSISLPTTTQINNGENKTITATVTFAKYQTGYVEGTIRANHLNGSSNATIDFKVLINSTATLVLSTVKEFSLTSPSKSSSTTMAGQAFFSGPGV